jgi:hypothetical protein
MRRLVLVVAAFVLTAGALTTTGVRAAGGHYDTMAECPKDHPEVVALVEAAKKFILENASDMNAATSWRQDPVAVATYPGDANKAFTEPQPHSPRSTTKGRWVPLGPVPNDFGYPDGYWHWVDWTNPPVDDTKDGIVRPADPQYLLLVQGDEYPHQGRYHAPADPKVYATEAARGWVVEGVMFAKDDTDPAPELFSWTDEEGNEHSCNPFHGHGATIENPHFHVWPWHHVHPFAMNPPHTCKGGTGYSKESPYPGRQDGDVLNTLGGGSGWGCMYDTTEADEHMGFVDPGVPADEEGS